MKRKINIATIIAITALLLSSSAFANKTSVTIVAPEKATKGSEVTIKIEVKHIGNTQAHYTDWVWVKVNGEEYKRWEYTPENLPEDQNFTLEFKIKVEDTVEIIAEGDCNKHGSKGEDNVKIIVE